MQHIAAFTRLARTKFLLGGILGFGLGAAVAAYEGARVTPGLYLAGQTLVTAFHLMTHFSNEYFDRHTDGRSERTDFSGGSGVLISGALAPQTALVAALTCAAIGAATTVGFVWAGQPIVAFIGTAIGFFAWSYSAPPLRLAARGWGELDAALVVGILVPLAGYAVSTGSIDGLALAATCAPACAMFAMMIAVEWPDRAADAAGAKQNLVVRFGAAIGARLAAGAAVLVIPALLLAIGFGAPWIAGVFGVLLVAPISGFVGSMRMPQALPAEIAARGVGVFLLTTLFAGLGYLMTLR